MSALSEYRLKPWEPDGRIALLLRPLLAQRSAVLEWDRPRGWVLVARAWYGSVSLDVMGCGARVEMAVLLVTRLERLHGRLLW